MADERYRRLSAKIRAAIADRPRREALYSAMKRGRDSRAKAVRELPGGEAFRDEVRAIKLRCLERQDELLDRFADNARKRGAQVYRAADGAEAIAQVLEIARKCGAKTVAKSKSLTSEEIEVNHPIEAAGIRVIETDLGELIIQLVHEKPYHLVFPAVHKTAKEVAEIFEKETGKPVGEDVDEIMKVVRRYLRPIFLHADIGMTGANVAIAETGAIVIETNEGNARLVSSIPGVHVCIMGMEKVVETFDDALVMMLAHPLSAVGQKLTTYVTLMAGRSPLGSGPDGKPRETHIIILDNGRTAMRADSALSDALNCIRCGACMNICPTYGVIGGHTFGHIYPGPIGIPWTAAVHGLENAAEFAPLCVSCGLCKEICPVKIDIPMMIAEVKHRDLEQSPQLLANRVLMQADAMARIGSLTAPIANLMLKFPPVRWLMEKTLGLDRHRKLPRFAFRTFKRRFASWRRMKRTPAAKRRVAFFVDLYANFNNPDLGMAAVEWLDAYGCDVLLPPQRSSGYPYISYGDLDRARRTAAYNVEQFAPFARDGCDIVATEPTASYCLRLAYPKLLAGDPDARIVSERTHEIFAYLIKLEDESGGRPGFSERLKGRRFGFHISCHQRPLGAGTEAMEWLRRQGAEVKLVETGTCCGMAGTFGLKVGPLGYDLSQAVGEPLFEAFREAEVEVIVTESSVCGIHLAEGTGLEIRHPLELLKRPGS